VVADPLDDLISEAIAAVGVIDAPPVKPKDPVKVNFSPKRL
jgi:hypothetical protein